MRNPSVRFAFPLLIIANLALALGPVMVRQAAGPGGVGPVAAAFWRLLLATPMLWIILRVTRQPMPPLSRRSLAPLFLAGLFFAGDLAAWHVGILHTRLANGTLFGNITSFTFPIYGLIIARAWPGRAHAAALLLALLGTALLLGRSFELSLANAAGDLFCILAGLLYTAYLIVLEQRGETAPLPSLFVATLVGAPVLLLAAWAIGEPIWPRSFVPLLLLALGSQVIGQGLTILVLRSLSPVVVGLTLLVQPVLAAMAGWLLYEERLALLDWIGAAVIGIALVLVRLPDRRTLSPPSVSL